MTEYELEVLDLIYETAIDRPPILEDLVGLTGLDAKVLRGVITSLNKKGLVSVRQIEESCFEYIVENCDWPCDHYTYEEWQELKSKALAAAQAAPPSREKRNDRH